MRFFPKKPASDARLASDINLILAARQASTTETTRAVPPPDDQDPEAWLRAMFPGYVRDFAAHHKELWQWVWGIEKGKPVHSFVAIWPRGGTKSTSAELACVALAAKRARRYGLYISMTQQQADDHVQNVASMLESDSVARAYPDLGNRLIGKFGNPRGWRRNRLRTESGFTIDAIGLDTAARGVKLESRRCPNLKFINMQIWTPGTPLALGQSLARPIYRHTRMS
jgi:hypothetical protein